ncbi:hypothetical protein PVAND_006319 [Polypedilum vanderplanki]|uniref:HAT C-terminal dimerisation domain-containing protein n=1 Tax=Polypedilum vanderplanki TaxID=319348 RepID=A0A9J6C3P9_POLVA|nr:hypothetical protein PVAND_006319 [Polypedilum vanderplanki]
MPPTNQKELIEKVNSYFNNLTARKFHCSLCDKNFSGTISNKKDHLLAKHATIAESIGLKGKDKQTNNNSNEDSDASISVNSQPTKKIKLEVDINDFIRSHIKLIMLHNHALSTIEDMMKMPHNLQICDTFKVTINRRTFTQFIVNASKQIYKAITEEIKDKFPSLGFDSASKHGRSVFSVHMRYILKGEIKERTLGIVTQHGRQFGNVLASQIVDLLSKIEKSVDDIYACCSDGGANMLKAQDCIIAAQTEFDIYSAFFDTDDQLNVTDFIFEDDSIEQTEENDDESDEPIDFGSIININEGIGSFCSKGYCGAHLCQLAAREITKDFESILQKIRAFVKESKKIQYIDIFRELKKPCLDIGPRWDSTFLMIEKFEEQKISFSQIRADKLKLSREVWNFINEYYEAFRPVHMAMKDFQQSKYTSSDFMLRWIRMQLQLERIADGFFHLPSKLSKIMKEKSKKFLMSEAFCAALVLDPRFTWNAANEIFNETIRDRGIKNIVKVYSKIHLNDEMANTEETLSASLELSIVNQQYDEDFSLQEFLGGGPRVEYGQNTTDIKIQIMKFIHSEPRIRPSEHFNILSFWHDKRDEPTYRDLYLISQVVYGQSFSQVKTERDFSSFGLIYNHLRTRLSDDVLNAIFVVKHNLDLLNEVNFF